MWSSTATLHITNKNPLVDRDDMGWDKYIVPLNPFSNLHSDEVTDCYFRTNLFRQVIQHGLKRMTPEPKAIRETIQSSNIIKK
jgi:hypothetical protein